ncbi:MAG: hypothetical protein K0B01_02885 [Syntrophobacterales bacterium]|nr:hypothetical protein [Syntrophobacterales bacterium]
MYRHFPLAADILDLAHLVGHSSVNMIFSAYAHLVEEMRQKTAFQLPELNFANTPDPILLAKIVSQDKSKEEADDYKQLISKRKIGRGEVI